MPAEPVFTVGHSNRSLLDFIAVLRSADIRTLVDVRRFPASRRHPHFNIGPLRDELAAVSIAYRHLPELGGYRDRTGTPSASPNDGWPVEFLRNYADYAMTGSFQACFNGLRQSLGARSALMCAERRWTNCHRQIIADYLIARGHQVIHLIDTTTREEARPTPFAKCLEQGTISYPASPAQLRFDL
jgi:uncharacterized protein (DUF488 family)